MGRVQLFLTSLVAAIPAGFLTYLVAMMFVNQSENLSTTLMGVLIKHFGVQTTYAFGANILSSLAINYVMRKFFVFKG